jgi:hypothetical protein
VIPGRASWAGPLGSRGGGRVTNGSFSRWTPDGGTGETPARSRRCVIVGGGFGGSQAAKALKDVDVEIEMPCYDVMPLDVR